jgi:hypothetical protein
MFKVMSDKIGTSIYYWSFPSDAKRMRQLKIGELNKEMETLSRRERELAQLIDEVSSVRQENVPHVQSLIDLLRRTRTNVGNC